MSMILVVEDDDLVRGLVRAQLESRGHEVVTASTGAEALALLDGEARDAELVVSDMRMPGMTGSELAAAVRRSRPRLGVVLLSGTTDDVGTTAGAPNTAFLQKPFTTGQLERAVRALLPA